jgi:hypothetical protein
MVGLIREVITAQELCKATRREIERYIGFSPQANLYPLLDDTHQTYAVVIVPHWPRQLPAEIVVMARVVGEQIVIEEETTDKPLVEALMVNAGIPREQIVLAYSGEKIAAE